MMRDKAEGPPRLPSAIADRMEHRRIGTRLDHGVGFRAIEPSGGMVVPEPRGNKNRVVRDIVGCSQGQIHLAGAPADVVVVYSLQHPQAGVTGFGPRHILPLKSQLSGQAEMGTHDQIDTGPQIVDDAVTAATQRESHLAGPLVRTPVRTGHGPHVQCNRSRIVTAEKTHDQNAWPWRKGVTSTVISGPRR